MPSNLVDTSPDVVKDVIKLVNLSQGHPSAACTCAKDSEAKHQSSKPWTCILHPDSEHLRLHPQTMNESLWFAAGRLDRDATPSTLNPNA